MKFLLIKNIAEDKGFRPLIIGLLFFTLLFLVIDVFVQANSFGVFYQTLFNTLYGNEEEYMDPIEVSVFLEFWHINIFLMMMVLLTLSSIYIRLNTGSKFSTRVVSLTLVTALFSLISIALSFYISDIFLVPYIVAFWFWHAGALFMAIQGIKKVLFA